jgi:hypothetical protein
MSASMYDAFDFALDRITRAMDNPARVATPDHVEVSPRTRREFAEFSPAEQRRLVDHWLSTKNDPKGWVTDQLVDIDANKVLLNFLAGDDAENGRLIAQALLALGDRIDRDHQYWEQDDER